VVPVKGGNGIGDFCIERFEHIVDGDIAHDVTWADAKAGCEEDGGFLCSEAQWQRACETEPGSSDVRTFGAMEVGADANIDSVVWLREVCGVATGPSDSSSATDTTKRDPRCVSGWGVRDMPGHLAEWTRDVWFSRREAIPSSSKDSWSGAYLDTSDYTGKADHGVLRGGSWIDLRNLALSQTLSKCRSRTYAAYSTYDTLPGNLIIRIPNPAGKATSFGYRCCFKPL
jgi:formylglycine-generating enzyme required for sulfatase activity